MMLSADLIDRLRRRAADPAGRSDAPDQSPETSYLGGAFKTVRIPLGGAAEAPAGPTPLPPPASPADLAAAEARLGFALPDDLKQLYGEVANGGFGPSGGLAPLEAAAQRYRALMAEPPGEGGQSWPVHLLPINLSEPGADCYDLRSGGIVYWDEESLAEGPDDRVWRRAFRAEAQSLAAWLEGWLARPPLAEQLKQDVEQGLRDQLKTTIAHWRAKSPEERAAFGLPEEGWEQALFGHLGIDLDKL